MPTLRNDPYSAFRFLVRLGGPQGEGTLGEVIGGFSEVNGFSLEVNYAEYRNGNERTAATRKVASNLTVGDVTLRRGLIGSPDLFQWLKSVTEGERDRRNVAIILLDEAGEEVVTWVLERAQPKRWAGPNLTAKGGGDVAMEELVLVYEVIRYE